MYDRFSLIIFIGVGGWRFSLINGYGFGYLYNYLISSVNGRISRFSKSESINENIVVYFDDLGKM